MRRHRRGQQRKRGYLHARKLKRTLDDHAAVHELAYSGSFPRTTRRRPRHTH
jgi:hypothetical protein